MCFKYHCNGFTVSYQTITWPCSFHWSYKPGRNWASSRGSRPIIYITWERKQTSGSFWHKVRRKTHHMSESKTSDTKTEVRVQASRLHWERFAQQNSSVTLSFPDLNQEKVIFQGRFNKSFYPKSLFRLKTNSIEQNRTISSKNKREATNFLMYRYIFLKLYTYFVLGSIWNNFL